MKINLYGGSWGFQQEYTTISRVEREIQTSIPEEVSMTLKELQQFLDSGLMAIGFISYEAASCWNMPVRSTETVLPLVWFALLKPDSVIPCDTVATQTAPGSDMNQLTNLKYEVYSNRFNRIHEEIASGNTYQVNYTQRIMTSFAQSNEEVFRSLYQNQPVGYAAFIETDAWCVLSLSPEAFLSRQGNTLSMKPMKGTATRAANTRSDYFVREQLRGSEKERAENLMIVDMCRNDLGAICKTGSVEVQSLFDVETYRTIHQMTSSITGTVKDHLSLEDILRSTFPAASVTGAPKRSTMSIIAELEDSPREVYCGSIGVFHPSGDFTLNVAIRTLWGKGNTLSFGVGSGVVWDSVAQSEFDELKAKAAFLGNKTADFQLIETMRVDSPGHIVFLDEHLNRLADSAAYWQFPCNTESIRESLLRESNSLPHFPWVVRLTLDQQGNPSITNRQALSIPDRVCLSLQQEPVQSGNRFFQHKTTNRALYDREWNCAKDNGYFDSIFRNERACVTEGCITNLFARIGKQWVTPLVSDGVLPGVWRQWFMEKVNAQETPISIKELLYAEHVVIGNSVCMGLSVDEIHDGDKVYHFSPWNEFLAP